MLLALFMCNTAWRPDWAEYLTYNIGGKYEDIWGLIYSDMEVN